MKKVLIVGGTGIISQPIAEQLDKDKNIELYLLNRSGSGTNLSNAVKYLKADMKLQPNYVKELINDINFDCVIDFIIMNVKDAECCVKIFKEHCKQFIFISTVATLDHRFACHMDETSVYGNRFYNYGQEKERCEKYFLEEFRKGFPITIVRPTQTYAKDRIPLSIKGSTCWSVVQRIIEGKEVIVHGDGQSLWACTHAKDFACLFRPIVANPLCIGEIYQVMNPEMMTWDMIYKALADSLHKEYKPVYISTYLLENSEIYPGYKGSIHGDKHFSCVFDISKVKELCPDYTPQIDIRKGMEYYIDYMNKHPEKKVMDQKFDDWCDHTIALYQALTKEFVKQI